MMSYNFVRKTSHQYSESRHQFYWAFLFIMTVLCLAIFVFEQQLEKELTTSIKSRLEDSSSTVTLQVQENISKYKNDLHFLYSTPPIAGLARAAANNGNDPLDNTTTAQWRKRLETIFVAFIQANSEFEQLRVISTQDAGQELIRVDRAAGGIVVKAINQLQNKSSRDYYQQSAQLSLGDMYLSAITLNREYGKLEFPYKPMLRLALPIFDENMQRFGFIIANVNTQILFNSLSELVQTPHSLILTDNEGYFLIHPDQRFNFSRDLAPSNRWDTTYQTNTENLGGLVSINATYDNNKKSEVLSRRIPLSGDTESGFITSHILLSHDDIAKIRLERRISTYVFFLGVSLFLLFMLVFFYRNLKRNQELAQARAVSSAIISGSKDAIISINNKGVVTSWNKAATNLFSFQREQVLGTDINTLKLLPNIDIQKVCTELRDSRKRYEIDIDFTPQSQTSCHLTVAFSAIINEHQQQCGTAIIIRDNTLEKEASNKIKQANNELEVKVAKRTAQLEKASQVKSAFISNISHEMRTPLNGIIGTLNLIKRESLSNQQRHYLAMTEVSVNNLNVLINDILDLSKIEAGKLDLDKKAFNPIKFFESLAGSMAVKAQEKNLEFILDIADVEFNSIVTDPHRYSQVLTNLINNAIKFTKTGYVKFSAYTRTIDTNTAVLTCTIKDSGSGIPDEHQSKLFNAFTQADSTIASQYGGTGLGLSICKQLANLLDGEISFESIEGLGSTFEFSIRLKINDVQKSPSNQRLSGKTFALFVKHPELESSMAKLINVYGGELSNIDIEDFELTKSMPFETLILEPGNPLLAKLDSYCENECSSSLPFKLVVLINPTEPPPQARFCSFTRLSKPVLISEFLLKLADERVAQDLSVQNQKRRDSDAQTHIDASVEGAKILIVDDNEINAAVAKGTLTSLSLRFEVASNGRQAVDILANTDVNDPFHCVLMDCQMPVLNGYDAATEIRNGAAGEHHINIPIIAMTANAMLGERNKCLNAGMNDYITKPISADKLIMTTAKWISSVFPKQPNSKNKAPENQAQVTSEPEHSELITDERIHWNKEAALARLMNNEVLLNKVCKMFLDSSNEKITQLITVIKEQDYHGIATISHALKGTCGDVGATKLHQHFTELEVLAASKGNNLKDIQHKLIDIEKDYEVLLSILQRHTIARVS